MTEWPSKATPKPIGLTERIKCRAEANKKLKRHIIFYCSHSFIKCLNV